MSTNHRSLPGRPWRVRMIARSSDEEGRTATTLELLFDLVFVVAVSSAAASLHHGLGEGEVGHSLLSYSMVFFAIWWAWMNFSWFASAYDTDDVPYRVHVFVMMVGSIVLAAGVPAAFESGDFGFVALGYLIMRLPLVALWLRAARADPERAVTAHRYAIGITVLQVGWVALAMSDVTWFLAAFVVLAVLELLVPVWAERAAPTTWHGEHIAERYGLFTIIVLGETILTSTVAIQSAFDGATDPWRIPPMILGGLLIVFSMWWIYFDWPRHDLLDEARTAFVWGYGHYVVWAAAAAVGAGLAVNVDRVTGHDPGGMIAGAAVSVPVAIYLMMVWALHYLPRKAPLNVAIRAPVAAILILAAGLTEWAVPLTGLVLALLVVEKVVSNNGRFQPDALV